jgi:hypothetical protein
MITPQDDRFHPRSDDLYWNESSWMSFMSADRKLGGFFYFWHRPNMNLSSGGCVIWDGKGEEIYDCAHYDWHLIQKLPEGADMFDFRLDNSVEVRPIELGKSYRMLYDNNGVKLDVVWTSVMAPVNHSRQSSGAPEKAIDGWIQPDKDGLGIGHFEQGGWVQGTLNLRGETIPIDGPACRDHSWGPRDLSRARHAAYPWAVASPESSFLTWGINDIPRDDDPVLDTPMSVVGGWYVRDGVQSTLVSGERRVLKHGPDGRILHEVVDAKDELGRELHAEGRAIATLKLTCWNDIFDWWTLAQWEFDGQTCNGEMHEYFHFYPGHYNLRNALVSKTSQQV